MTLPGGIDSATSSTRLAKSVGPVPAAAESTARGSARVTRLTRVDDVGLVRPELPRQMPPIPARLLALGRRSRLGRRRSGLDRLDRLIAEGRRRIARRLVARRRIVRRLVGRRRLIRAGSWILRLVVPLPLRRVPSRRIGGRLIRRRLISRILIALTGIPRRRRP